MCSAPRKPSTPPPPPATAAKDPAAMASLLLELAAADDVVEFRRVVEEEKACLDAAGSWYGPSAAGLGRLGAESRTPAMVAALYGSTAVLAHALSVAPAEACRASDTDGATALHLAAVGGAANAVAATHLLLAAGASTEALSVSGLRAGDLLPRAASVAEKPLRLLLKSPAASPSSSPKKSFSPPATVAAQEPRKEYPPDLTLPDLKSGLFSTDEFRMYSFKVKPCSRAYSHDWTECPFVHPGENARRRDPRRYSYSCVPCPEFRKGGACRKADGCEYAHGVFECWLHPAQYRTRLCKDEVGCARRICFFAHRRDELRSVNPSAVSVGMMQPVSPRSSPPTPNGMDMAMINWPSSPASRLKTARELDFDLEMLALDQYQQKLFDKMSNTNSAHSPRASWGAPNGSPHAAASQARNMPDYTDLLGSMDPAMLSQLHALSLKQAGDMSAYSSMPDTQLHMPTSPMVGANNSFGLDHSMAKAIMTSRASAFAKRSQSFIDRGARAPAARSLMSPATIGEPSMLTDWGSPSAGGNNLDWGSPGGKLDWGVQGDELHKFRKSASFAFRGQSAMPVAAPATTPAEPDVSWVNSLVKDGHTGDHFPPWLEQEQMVA